MCLIAYTCGIECANYRASPDEEKNRGKSKLDSTFVVDEAEASTSGIQPLVELSEFEVSIKKKQL